MMMIPLRLSSLPAREPAPSVLSQGAEQLNASRRDATETLRWFFQLPESQQRSLRDALGPRWVGPRG